MEITNGFKASMKICELLFALGCLVLHCIDITNSFKTDTITAIAAGGYTIILLGAASGLLLHTPIALKIDAFYSFMGCIMFVVTAALNLENYNHLGGTSLSLAKGVLAIINSILMLLDLVIVCREEGQTANN